MPMIMGWHPSLQVSQLSGKQDIKMGARLSMQRNHGYYKQKLFGEKYTTNHPYEIQAWLSAG